MIKLREVKNSEREYLYNINQKYLYEMTNFYDNEIDKNGNINYGYFDLYFKEKERKAYFILNDDKIVGFTFINPYAYDQKRVDVVIAEFTIFPAFRNLGYGREAVLEIFKKHKGIYQIKYNKKNLKAKNLFEGVTDKFEKKHIDLKEEGIVIEFLNQ